MNRGINDSQDLPETYLAQIYDEIATSGLKLRGDDDHASKLGLVVSSATSTSAINSNGMNKRDSDSYENDCVSLFLFVGELFSIVF